MFNLISYAQNFEDIILWRALGHVLKGRYIDVGAQSPDEHSVSRLFYVKGWRGTHVEPTQRYSDLLRAARPDEHVIQAAVSDTSGELNFFDIADTGLSTLDAAIAGTHREAGFEVRDVRVPVITLDEVFDRAGEGEIHWLKIDVEGAEHEVVSGWNTDRRPWVLAIESTRPLSPEPSHQQWEPIVLGKGYVFAYFDGLNRFYVSEQHRELLPAFASGPNVFDDFVLAPQSSFCAAANAVAAERHAGMHADLTRVTEAVELLRADEARLQSENLALQGSLDSQQATFQAQLAEAEERNAEIQSLRGLLDIQRSAASELRHEAEMLREAVAGYKEDLERAVMHGHALSGEVHRREGELAHQKALMQEMLDSKSWRVTQPLRVSMWYVNRVVHQPRAFARETLLRSMAAVLARPRLGRAVNTLIRLAPPLHERLRLLASDRGIVTAHPEPMLVGGLGQVQYFGDDSGSELLSLRARRIHARLHPASKQGDV